MERVPPPPTGGYVKSIQELPPIWERWEWDLMMYMSKEETDRLFAMLEKKIEVVKDLYEWQLYYKKRVEARKDKQILGSFSDGR